VAAVVDDLAAAADPAVADLAVAAVVVEAVVVAVVVVANPGRINLKVAGLQPGHEV
jgi:hypothetical protein